MLSAFEVVEGIPNGLYASMDSISIYGVFGKISWHTSLLSTLNYSGVPPHRGGCPEIRRI